MSLLDHHEPESWRFYVYGSDDAGEPLFSFWMNIGPNTGVCLYERNGGEGKWLSTHHDDEEYQGQPPSEDLKEVLRDLIRDEVAAERVHDLPDHERYFVQSVHGTLAEKGKIPDELLRFLEQLTGSTLRIA